MWHPVGKETAFQADEGKGFDVVGKKVGVFFSEGRHFAVDNVCTHQYALLSDGYVEDGCVECPLHQALFDLDTGKPTCGPATEPVKVYPIKIEDGTVYVDVD